MISTLVDPIADREAATELAVRRLVAVLNTNCLPPIKGFRAERDVVTVEVQRVAHLANWRFHCDCPYAVLTTSVALDAATNRWVSKSWFDAAWQGVQFRFVFVEPATAVTR